MEYTFLLPFIFLSTVIVYIFVPLAGVIRYYRPAEKTIWANIFWIVLGLVTWPLVPIILVIRRKDPLLNLIFWGGFIIWICALTIYISQNVDYMVEFLRQYYTINGESNN